MAYVRNKGGYYQLVESHRVDGQPRQKVLLHLGSSYPTVEKALKGWPKEAKRLRRDAEQKRVWVPAGQESQPYYKKVLERADALDKQAAALEEKLGRLRSLKGRVRS